MSRGRPFPPGNQFGRGRPQGSRNKKTSLPQALLELHADAILQQSVELAENGDSHMLRFLLGYILPRPKELPLKIGSMPMGTATELSQASEKLMRKVTGGKVSLSDALEITALMARRRQIIETQNLELRIQTLEQKSAEEQE